MRSRSLLACARIRARIRAMHITRALAETDHGPNPQEQVTLGENKYETMESGRKPEWILDVNVPPLGHDSCYSI